MSKTHSLIIALMNKKIFIILAVACLVILPSMASALAEPTLPTPISGTNSFWPLIEKILNFIWPIFIGVAVIMFIVAGFLFLTSNGEPGKLTNAKNAVIWGVIGVIVGILAFSIPRVI